MASADGNPGMNKLARAIDAQMKRYHADITGSLEIDFGEIGKDFSLRVNSFPKPIPKGDYYVCRTIGGLSVSGSGHSHSLPKLKKGDHVLVAWVQNEICVIDVIVSSSKL